MAMLGITLLGAGDTIFVGETLKGMGVAGAIIIVLMGVITVLSAVIALLWKHSNKVYGYRLAERDVLNAALNDSKTALYAMLAETKERNEITEELADVVSKQASAFDALSERIRMHYERLIDDNSRMNLVVNAISEAMRAMIGVSTDTRNTIVNVDRSLGELKAKINRQRRKA